MPTLGLLCSLSGGKGKQRGERVVSQGVHRLLGKAGCSLPPPTTTASGLPPRLPTAVRVERRLRPTIRLIVLVRHRHVCNWRRLRALRVFALHSLYRVSDELLDQFCPTEPEVDLQGPERVDGLLADPDPEVSLAWRRVVTRHPEPSSPGR